MNMQPRMTNIAYLYPDALKGLQAVSKAGHTGGVPTSTLELVRIRASQINGCSHCLNMHMRDARKAGETDNRLFTIAGWRDSPYFTEAERAALALTEAATRLSDQNDPVPDAIWNEAAEFYDEKELGSLVLEIAMINLWNRLNVTTRQPATDGAW
jgi:AhpD family alkylhydroperoxidase